MSKKQRLFEALRSGEVLTPIDSLNRYGVHALSQRCTEWQRQGQPIKSERVPGQPYHRYFWQFEEERIAW